MSRTIWARPFLGKTEYCVGHPDVLFVSYPVTVAYFGTTTSTKSAWDGDSYVYYYVQPLEIRSLTAPAPPVQRETNDTADEKTHVGKTGNLSSYTHSNAPHIDLL